MFEPVGLGTFRIKGQQLTDLVETALDIGYRHIDTATMYGNEADIGKALRKSNLGSDKVFVTTKVWHEDLEHDALLDSLKRSADNLQRDRIDLALIHWPSPGDKVPLQESLDALQRAKQDGLIANFGVSNFTRRLLKQAVGHVGPDNILTNQVELHPFMQNRAITNLCDELGIRVTAYMPLAVGKVMEEPALQEIADAHDTSPAAVALAWLLHNKRTVIPSSTKAEHLRSNFDAQHLPLSAQELKQIDALDRNERIIDPDFAPDWDE
jgi:2,5-diketo-D-gluconate reductase B